jgi:AcrR family transcriptional regulator
VLYCATNVEEDTVAKPLIPREEILDRALELLDAEGLKALNVRRLSTVLRISPNTMYQQIGNQAALTRALVARHFSRLKLDFVEYETWEATALHWCLALRDALRTHPHLTELVAMDDRDAIRDYVQDLLKSMVGSGISRPLALECCRGLTNMTFSHVIAEARTRSEHSPTSETEVRKVDRNFRRLVTWVIAAVGTEAAADRVSAKRMTKTGSR